MFFLVVPYYSITTGLLQILSLVGMTPTHGQRGRDQLQQITSNNALMVDPSITLADLAVAVSWTARGVTVAWRGFAVEVWQSQDFPPHDISKAPPYSSSPIAGENINSHGACRWCIWRLKLAVFDFATGNSLQMKSSWWTKSTWSHLGTNSNKNSGAYGINRLVRFLVCCFTLQIMSWMKWNMWKGLLARFINKFLTSGLWLVVTLT